MALTRIIETIDVDCDGIYHAFQRVSLPSSAVDNPDAALTYAVKTGQMLRPYHATVGAVLTLTEFLRSYGPAIEAADLEVARQWWREGYWSFVQYRPGV